MRCVIATVCFRTSHSVSCNRFSMALHFAMILGQEVRGKDLGIGSAVYGGVPWDLFTFFKRTTVAVDTFILCEAIH